MSSDEWRGADISSGLDVFHVLNFTVAQGVVRYGDAARESARKELRQMETKQVWTPLTASTDLRGKKVIPSKMFQREKFSSTGEF